VPRVVYGQNPVRELLTARAKEVNVVYLAAGDTGAALRDLHAICRSRGVEVEERGRAELDALAGAGARHQGVVAIAGEYVYADLDQLLEDLEGKTPLLVVLDGVQDPRNLGAIVRSAHALGADGVVIGKDRAAPVTPAAVKAAAGATEHVPIARVTNLARALETLKQRGVWTAGAVVEDAPPPHEVDLTGPIALVLGAEGKGLRPLVERGCDHRVLIPMLGQVASLNVSVAAGILLYEATRQRGKIPAWSSTRARR
jgi:23S rRNA (guanosine2251-2'-O)-methyltransferase